MNTLIMVLQVFVALGLLNVWLLRLNEKSSYRGSDAPTLKDEFISYGLPLWFFYFIGTLKVVSGILLILGLWIPFVVFPAALTIAILMVGALAMHQKVGDPKEKSLPALIMLILSLIICWGHSNW